MVTNKKHTCRWCQQEWEHLMGKFCPHCHRFQDTANEHKISLVTFDEVMSEEEHPKLSNPSYNMLGEVFVMIHYRGQIRFRFYLNEGHFVYSTSDMLADRKIEAMTGRNVSRISTTKELEEYEYTQHGLDRKQIIMHAFEHIVLAINNPTQYLNGMFRKEIQVDQDVVEIFMFPKWVKRNEK